MTMRYSSRQSHGHVGNERHGQREMVWMAKRDNVMRSCIGFVLQLKESEDVCR